MQAGIERVAGYHMDFLGKVFEAIGAPKLATIRESAKAVTVHERGCACCSPSLPPTTTKADVSISLAVDTAIDRAAQQLFSDVWGYNVDIHAQTPIQKTLYELVKQSVADGFANAEKAWEKLAAKDEAWALSNPFPEVALVPTAEMKWMSEIYEGGFTNVKDHVFKSLVPNLKKSIVEQFGAGLTVREVAENLYSSFGPGGADGPYSTGSGHLWQWQRLLRTEAHNAVFAANNAEFKDTGARYVQWSRATNSSKCRCITIAAFNNGYYAIDDVPEPPHPNCRCSTNPVFNLPKGVTVADSSPKPEPVAPVVPTPEPEPLKPVGPKGTGAGKATFTGKHSLSKEELADLQAHADAKLKEYGINDDVTIAFTSGKNGGGAISLFKNQRKVTAMQMASKPVHVSHKDVISHELKHIEQVNSGRFWVNANGDKVWDDRVAVTQSEFTRTMNKMSGKTAKTQAEINFYYNKYQNWPWEAEAYATAGK